MVPLVEVNAPDFVTLNVVPRLIPSVPKYTELLAPAREVVLFARYLSVISNPPMVPLVDTK